MRPLRTDWIKPTEYEYRQVIVGLGDARGRHRRRRLAHAYQHRAAASAR